MVSKSGNECPDEVGKDLSENKYWRRFVLRMTTVWQEAQLWRRSVLISVYSSVYGLCSRIHLQAHSNC